MSIHNEQELTVTREKLRLLEERVAALAKETESDAHVRELTLRSLKGLMNQFREEIALYHWCCGAIGCLIRITSEVIGISAIITNQELPLFTVAGLRERKSMMNMA